MDQPKEPDAGPHVRYCERRGGAIHRAYSTGVAATGKAIVGYQQPLAVYDELYAVAGRQLECRQERAGGSP